MRQCQPGIFRYDEESRQLVVVSAKKANNIDEVRWTVAGGGGGGSANNIDEETVNAPPPKAASSSSSYPLPSPCQIKKVGLSIAKAYSPTENMVSVQVRCEVCPPPPPMPHWMR